MNKFPQVNIIVCCDTRYGIGYKGKLPWNIPEEMKHFKEKTTQGTNCVIMGKNTYYSIPKKYRPLKNRSNCILSSSMNKSDLSYDEKDVRIFNTHFDLIQFIQKQEYDNYWIIGGESVYHFFLTHYSCLISEIHLSIIKNIYNCDRYFNFDFEHFKQIKNEDKGCFDYRVYKNLMFT